MRFISFFVCFIFLSFSSCEEVRESTPSNDKVAENGTHALVTTDYSDEGCTVLLEVEEDGQKVLLMPIELDEKYKRHGTKISIVYHSSRIVQSECQIGQPIIIDQVVLVD